MFSCYICCVFKITLIILFATLVLIHASNLVLKLHVLLEMQGAEIVIYYYPILLRCTLQLFWNWRELTVFSARVEICNGCTISS
jgi:hypothetical protein